MRCCDRFSGVKCTMVETEREGHAREVVQALSLAELQSYDGIVAVSPCSPGAWKDIMLIGHGAVLSCSGRWSGFQTDCKPP